MAISWHSYFSLTAISVKSYCPFWSEHVLWWTQTKIEEVFVGILFESLWWQQQQLYSTLPVSLLPVDITCVDLQPLTPIAYCIYIYIWLRTCISTATWLFLLVIVRLLAQVTNSPLVYTHHKAIINKKTLLQCYNTVELF